MEKSAYNPYVAYLKGEPERRPSLFHPFQNEFNHEIRSTYSNERNHRCQQDEEPSAFSVLGNKVDKLIALLSKKSDDEISCRKCQSLIDYIAKVEKEKEEYFLEILRLRRSFSQTYSHQSFVESSKRNAFDLNDVKTSLMNQARHVDRQIAQLRKLESEIEGFDTFKDCEKNSYNNRAMNTENENNSHFNDIKPNNVENGSMDETKVRRKSSLALPRGWNSATDDRTGKKYFYNKEMSTWEMPSKPYDELISDKFEMDSKFAAYQSQQVKDGKVEDSPTNLNQALTEIKTPFQKFEKTEAHCEDIVQRPSSKNAKRFNMHRSSFLKLSSGDSRTAVMGNELIKVESNGRM
mmetsp:Transcript_19448/g.28816  ORF Transcript_19448/g.28816 Transcript_19448/m.28816 type:complete len:350 (-) Transcript_19448:41-1090(-)